MYGRAPSPAPAHARWRRRSWLWVGLAAVVVLVLGLVGVRMWLTAPAHRITVSETVDQFRTQSSDTASASDVQLRIPAEGVYVYDSAGQESIDALGGDTHTYPPESAMTVRLEGCGYRLSWAPLSGRSETSVLCVRDGGVAIAQSGTAHEFFRQSDTENFVCDAGAWWLPPKGVTAWTTTCRTSDRVSTRNGRVVGSETLTIDGQQLNAVHVRYDDVLSAGSQGVTTSDLWLDPETGLVLKQHNEADTNNESPIGQVTYRETLDLTLRSVVPQR